MSSVVILAPVAQLDRALGCGPKGPAFESRQAQFNDRGVRSLDSSRLKTVNI